MITRTAELYTSNHVPGNRFGKRIDNPSFLFVFWFWFKIQNAQMGYVWVYAIHVIHKYGPDQRVKCWHLQIDDKDGGLESQCGRCKVAGALCGDTYNTTGAWNNWLYRSEAELITSHQRISSKTQNLTQQVKSVKCEAVTVDHISCEKNIIQCRIPQPLILQTLELCIATWWN